jgi:gamma-glutamylcyclotransferase (GGCT)/AIG2-like uncharacterized protein YtfP
LTRPLPLFVYGTLSSSGAEGALLSHLPRTPARVRGELWALPAGYPALVLSDTASFVHGELVAPPDERTLDLLDLYEGVAEGLYRRRVIDVVVGLKREPAWSYVMDAARARTGTRLPEGRWHGVRRPVR